MILGGILRICFNILTKTVKKKKLNYYVQVINFIPLKHIKSCNRLLQSTQLKIMSIKNDETNSELHTVAVMQPIIIFLTIICLP